MTKLDIDHALYFLNKLDPEDNSRHTIASEAPYGKDGLPKWESGATYNRNQRKYMIEDIIDRQERKSNVYYSVNRPCNASERQGWGGKNNIDDITRIRALAFDMDTLRPKDEVLNFIKDMRDKRIIPSIVVSTGGGYHLIYLLDKFLNTQLYRPAKTDEEKKINEMIIKNRSPVSILAKSFERYLRYELVNWKVDNMSNIDRVMRLPGTVNYPKAEKVARGQKEALAHIIYESDNRINLDQLKTILSDIYDEEELAQNIRTLKKDFVPSNNDGWTAYKKAKACCEFIEFQGLADSNEWYTLNVMLPLIGAIHDSNIHNRITIEEAEELFMLAVSGGERYGVSGRGPRYFMRQWKSHHPELKRNGTKSLGGLIWAAKENGMKLPWIDALPEDMQKEFDELVASKQFVTDEDIINVLLKYQR